ncbi:group II intron maturase-specific domain-containing protein [Solwaraspora sp. WMMA2065]|uniref:group II intron maturase-specific domain-containing protein n=1 Tax=Solwaraspora sp. WMMA2065 TaxID=3015166 RepID=UPI00259B48B8|nr:group II intron maturase-specific domain-containing protein [Solwaraspora sp. WMMA2065]WJK33064.1 group II intron maturase-specific domain-containing protein [Solwaraspora sp. WMMA2065]
MAHSQNSLGSRHKTLADLLHQLNSVLRGWCNYFRHGVSSGTFHYLDHFTWWRVTGWLRKRHPRITWKALRRRFLTASPGRRPTEGKEVLFLAQQVPIVRYRWRATNIPTPWTSVQPAETA